MHQHRFVKEAKRAVGPAGGPATGTRAEILRYEWVRDQLTERGRERARALGWSDTYGLSKAIGERTLIAAEPARADDRPPGDRRVRAAHARTPGWMESLKVADPILLGYGAGIIPGRFAANRVDPDGSDPGRLRRQRLPRRGRRIPPRRARSAR